MIYAFYADVFWMNSMLMNWAVLMAATRFRRQAGWKNVFRCLGAAALGSTIETIVIVNVRSYPAMTALSILAVIPGMVWIVFAGRGWKQFLWDLLLCFGVTILLGGIMTSLDERAGIGRIPFLMAVLGIFFAEILLHWLYGMVHLQQKIYPVELCSGGRTVRCNGLLDTGNMLRIPENSQAVHIVGSKIPGQLGLGSCDVVGMVSYQSLGTGEGKLPVYRIDSLQLLNMNKKSSGKAFVHAAIIAQADPGLLDSKPYQVILHSDVVRMV